jgi:hypothetical protein
MMSDSKEAKETGRSLGSSGPEEGLLTRSEVAVNPIAHMACKPCCRMGPPLRSFAC